MLAIVKEVIPTLVLGGAGIAVIEFVKRLNINTSPWWSRLQLFVLVYTVLTMCWDGYWVTHPSNEEVQWQREVNEYGLY